MINLDGANLILATSFGYYNPFVVELGQEISGRAVPPRGAALEQGHRSGQRRLATSPISTRRTTWTASPPASRSPTGKIGFVAAKPIPSVLSNINSVLLGARSVNPNATVQVIFTGEWSLPVREAEATNALVDAGCEVITCHVDSPKVVIETAEGRGVKTAGHNASQAPLAPKGFITGAEYKWETIYKAYADAIAAGETLPNFLVGGYNNDMLRNTPYGAGATPEAIAAADAAIAGLKAGTPIYKGTLKDNTGKVVVDKDYDNYDPYLDGMNWLLEGVQGSIT